MWSLWVSAALAAAPSVTIAWKADRATLEVVPAQGDELALDAPVDAELRWGGRALVFRGTGADLPLTIERVAGARVEADLTVPICDKATGVCQPVALALHADIPHLRKGALVMAVDEPGPRPLEQAPRGDAVVDEAFARAAREGRRVLLDFGAVWCPPCNLLEAEVLHADPPPAELDAVVVVPLDVDDPSSFAWKDRYDVGGYPTLVVTDPVGAELDRMVGYPGREAFLAWLAEAAARSEPVGAADPAALAPAEAAEVALRLVQRGDDPGPYLARAEQGEPVAALRLARVQVRPNLDDARWLAEHAPGRALDWVWGARALADEPGGADALRRALLAALPRAGATQAADLLYVLAELPGGDDAPLYAAAAASVRAALSGDPSRDRGHLTWLAELTRRAGDLDGALALLADAADRWPAEPTFHMAAAGLLLEEGRPADALPHTERALAVSWGDNKLRAAADHCAALVALDRAHDARAVAERVLAEVPAPPEDLDVRTPRYREELAAYLADE